MKYLAFSLMLAVAGCAHAQATSEVHSPYERYLPQVPPSETNRVEFAGGFSIVSPVGWTYRTIPIEDWFKRSVSDQIVIEWHVHDEYPPRITIQHLGSDEYRLYHGWLQSTERLRDGWTQTQFQGQPALAKFLPGSGKRQAVRGSYQPWLTQSLFFERAGNGFILIFDMRNADRNKPYYTHPVAIVERYFETFRFTTNQIK